MSVSLHILAADDQPEITSYLQEYLSSLGHRVDAAANGIEALTLISSAHREQDGYQLLLIDARMPLLDGLSLVRELRRAKDPTDVAFICGDPSMMTLLDNEAQHLGCLMVLSKPFDPAQLVQLVEFVAMRCSRRLSAGGQAGQAAAAASSIPPALEPTAPAAPARSPSPSPVADEYLPTTAAQTARRERGETQQVERRSQVFYPTEPLQNTRTPLPGSVPRTPSPIAMPPSLQGGTTSAHRQGGQLPQPQGGTTSAHRQGGQLPQPQRPQDPRYTSRIAQPQVDPRQTLGLPPVPTGRDPRYTSRIAQPPATPPTQPPAQPGPRLPPSIDPYARRATTTSRIEAPLATPPIQPGQIRNPANGTTEARRSVQMPPGQHARPLPPPPAPPPPPPQRGSIRPELLPDRDPEPTIGRMRRSVGGDPGNQAQDGSVARMVSCAKCGGAFRAMIKAQPYNLVCVHCGQLNRIDP